MNGRDSYGVPAGFAEISSVGCWLVPLHWIGRNRNFVGPGVTSLARSCPILWDWNAKDISVFRQAIESIKRNVWTRASKVIDHSDAVQPG